MSKGDPVRRYYFHPTIRYRADLVGVLTTMGIAVIRGHCHSGRQRTRSGRFSRETEIEAPGTPVAQGQVNKLPPCHGMYPGAPENVDDLGNDGCSREYNGRNPSGFISIER